MSLCCISSNFFDCRNSFGAIFKNMQCKNINNNMLKASMLPKEFNQKIISKPVIWTIVLEVNVSDVILT